jgi:hypothetical protein
MKATAGNKHVVTECKKLDVILPSVEINYIRIDAVYL